jgi:hypothetical protein
MHRTRVALAACVAAIALFGCSVPATVIRNQSVSYDDAIEDTTNELLLLNILRAKDKAPLHFDTIPAIHESLQANAQLQAAIPFGALNKSTARDTATPALGVQVAPSFEIDHLITKDFAMGIASPIDAKFVKYWLDRGLDRRIILLLFFSRAEVTGPDDQGHLHAITIRNSPADALDDLDAQQSFGEISGPRRCDAQSQFQHYLRLIDSLTTFTARYVTERRVLAENVVLDAKSPLKDLATLASLDPNKFQWERTDNNHYSIYAISAAPKTVLCFANQPVDMGSQNPSDRSACLQSVVESTDMGAKQSVSATPVPPPEVSRVTSPSTYCQVFNQFVTSVSTPEKPSASANGASSVRLEIRSVGEMIQFLGDLVAYQEALKARTGDPQRQFHLNNPVTLGYCADEPEGARKAGCADIFFNLRRTSCDTRFGVRYRGGLWAVPNYSRHVGSDCPGEEPEDDTSGPAKDHTLEVFSVVQQLVDLQQSATDILQTPYVQVLP